MNLYVKLNENKSEILCFYEVSIPVKNFFKRKICQAQ